MINVPWSKADVDRAVQRISREAPAARIQRRNDGLGLAAIRGGSPKDGAAIIFDPVACIQADLDEAMSDQAPVYLRIARAVQRIQMGQCVVFISLADADEMMKAPPPGWTEHQIMKALDGREVKRPLSLRQDHNEIMLMTCCGRIVRLDRGLPDHLIEIEIGDGAERIKKIEASKEFPYGC